MTIPIQSLKFAVPFLYRRNSRLPDSHVGDGVAVSLSIRVVSLARSAITNK